MSKKKKAILIGVILLIICFILDFLDIQKKEILKTAAIRQLKEEDQYNIIISDEFTALAGTPIDSSFGINIMGLMNNLREANGFARLTWSNDLAYSATVRAQEASKYWSHTRPDGSDYYTVNSAIIYGENLAKGYTTEESVEEAWEASPSHRDNILFGNFKTCGIGIYTDSLGTIYVAAEFGY